MDDRFEEILKRKSARLNVINGSFGRTGQNTIYSIQHVDKQDEHLLEVRTRDGLCSSFQYFNIVWLVYEPEIGIIIDFNGYTLSIEGKGLNGEVYEAIKRRRLSWIRESDDPNGSDQQELCVTRITINPPEPRRPSFLARLFS